MHAKDGVAGVTETPWGLKWADLLTSLRPTKNQNSLFQSIVEQVDVALRRAGLKPDRVIAGGAYGKQTLSRSENALDIFAVFEEQFQATNYLDAHLKPMMSALTVGERVPFVNVEERGLAVNFTVEGIKCRLMAAGVLQGGPKDLLLDFKPRDARAINGAQPCLSTEAREIHIETTCAVARMEFIRMQPPVYKDMVRVAKKWRDSSEFTTAAEAPGDYLMELVMLEAFQSAPASSPSPDFYATILRRFLATMSSQSGSGSDVVASSDMPKTMLTWTTFYNQGAIDYCIARGLLRMKEVDSELRSLCVVDPAVPFIDVASTVPDWGEIRKCARESLSHFQNTEMVEVLRNKLHSFSVSVEETLKSLRGKLSTLESIEASPRRWSGTVQFTELHISGDSWAPVLDLELRCLKWRINARRARSDNTGYSRVVDVSLQVLEPLSRTIDVDVKFQTVSSQLVFGPNAEHVLVARRSEVLRNRDYVMQITVVA